MEGKTLRELHRIRANLMERKDDALHSGDIGMWTALRDRITEINVIIKRRYDEQSS